MAVEHDGAFRQLVARCQSQGWRIARTRRGHWRFVPPQREGRIVVMGGTPGDRRALANLRADLRRQGARV